MNNFLNKLREMRLVRLFCGRFRLFNLNGREDSVGGEIK